MEDTTNNPKPTLLLRQEFIEKLLCLINESEIPLIIIQPILEGILNEVSKAIHQQYEKEKTEYEEILRSKEKVTNE